MNKTLRKPFMLKFKLTNRVNKSKDTRDIRTCKQQLLVVRLNKDRKYSYFSNLDIRKLPTPFWNV